MPNRCLRGHFVGDTPCRVCEPDRSDYVLGVRRVPELDAQLDRDLQAIREAERSVDLNVRIGEPWTGWTAEDVAEVEAETQRLAAEIAPVWGELDERDLANHERAKALAVSVRPRHRRPVKRFWQWKR